MQVEVLRATENPEELVCQAARGDYYEGYVGNTDYYELMGTVDTDERHRKQALEEYGGAVFEEGEEIPELSDMSISMVNKARTQAFIEKQLSRGHYGPWEHPSITFTVEGVSRVTMAQITRHRHLTFDIQSMRYADFSEQEIVTPKSLTDEEHFSRETGMVDIENMEELFEDYESLKYACVDLYQEMVDKGVPKEDARFILPLGTTVNMTFSGNARSFLHLLDMRRKANAQWEIRELSEALLDELFDWMPYTFEYYKDHGPNKLSP